MNALWEKLLISLWFVPALMSAAAAIAALVLLHSPIEQLLPLSDLALLYGGGAVDASELLATLLGSIITMATLVISITMVVLTLAANQLGPRLIRNFMGDRQTQVTIGLFLATVIYLMLVLRRVHSGMEDNEVPRLAVSLGTALVLCCVVMLVVHVHHLARSINPEFMIARVGAALDHALRHQLPDADSPRVDAPPVDQHKVPISLGRSGYVQYVDYPHLLVHARAHDLIFELDYRAGYHLMSQSTHAYAWGAELEAGAAAQALIHATTMGSTRTPTQDLEFSIRELVEVALRALSPGMNDEFTALAVVDRLAESMGLAAGRSDLPFMLCDEKGALRVIRKVSDFEGMCDTAFHQLRQSARPHASVLIRLMEKLGALVIVVPGGDKVRVLTKHMDLVLEAAERNVDQSQDFDEVRRHYERALHALSNRTDTA